MKRYVLVLICLSLILTIVSCSKDSSLDIPSDIEVVTIASHRRLFSNLQEVEEEAEIIVEAVPKKNLGQTVKTEYNELFEKELAGYGYTVWETEIAKVYKGDVKEGDKINLLQSYYIWEEDDGKKRLISHSSHKPIEKNKKYLLFLVYSEPHEAHCAVSDYQGLFSIPNAELKERAEKGTLTKSDLELYNDEALRNVKPIYTEVVEKYFK